MPLVTALWLLLANLAALSCNAAQPTWHIAEVDVDYAAIAEGQTAFPHEWQRELMALTALSRLEAANILSLDTRKEKSAWKRFRSNGIYEALLNMVRITNFQMYDRPWPNAWSMWGLEKSFAAYAKDARYSQYRSAAKNYLFEVPSLMTSLRLRQATMALVMAALWDVDLKSAKFYSQPFYSVSETIQGLLKLRDPTCYFTGNQAEGERLLRKKLFYPDQPYCPRDARIVIAFDSYGYNERDMLVFNELFEEMRRFIPHARITVRGTAKLPGGLPEGGELGLFSKISAVIEQKDFEILDLVEHSIDELKPESDGILRAKVILIISKFRYRHSDTYRARGLNTEMTRFDIEPFYFTVETADVNYVDLDLMPLLNDESFRGISTGSSDQETVRTTFPRLLRLICEVPAQIPFQRWETFESYGRTANSIYDRIHLRFEGAPYLAGQFELVGFNCLRAPPCQSDVFVHSRRRADEKCSGGRPVCAFDVYVHNQRFANEYFHDVHKKFVIPLQGVEWFGMPEKYQLYNLVVVPESAITVGVERWTYRV